MIGNGIIRFSQILPATTDSRWPQFFGCLQSKGGFLQVNIDNLSSKYSTVLHTQSGDFDGRSFLSSASANGLIAPRKVAATPSVGAGIAIQSPAARKLGAELAKASVLNSSMNGTPLSARGMAARWRQKKTQNELVGAQEKLKSVVASYSSETPLPSLCAMFEKCTKNRLEPFVQRAKAAVERLVFKDGRWNDAWGIGLKLYYRSTEILLRHEESRLGRPAVADLLMDAKFFRPLLACALEVVRFCWRIKTTSFEDIMELVQVRAFDFVMIIENFLKHDTGVRHLLQAYNK